MDVQKLEVIVSLVSELWGEQKQEVRQSKQGEKTAQSLTRSEAMREFQGDGL